MFTTNTIVVLPKMLLHCVYNYKSRPPIQIQLMKKKILFLSMVLSSFFSFGQTCGGILPPEVLSTATEKAATCTASGTSYNNKYKLISNYQLNSATTSKTLKVAMHVWGNSSGAASWPNNTQTPIDVAQMQDWMNNFYTMGDPSTEPFSNPTHYPNSKISIEIVAVYFYNDNTMYGNTNGSTLNSYVTTNYPSRMNALPIHCVTSSSGAGAGWATGPAYQNDGDLYVVTKMGIVTNGLFSIAQHLAHELGHCLDLYHTYDGNCTGIQWDTDSNGNGDSCCPETQDATSNEYISDIWKFSDNWCGSPTGVCYECTTVPPATNINGQPNSSNNMMSGIALVNYYFSPLQQAKMHRAAAIKSVRKYIWGYSTTPMNITASETWDFNIKIYQDLVVKPGVTLTIKCSVYMVPEASVIVEPGGKLIIDGGTITTGTYSPTYWKGVQVWGTSNQHQYPIGAPTYQGYLQIINAGSIENAINGARNWKPDDYNKIGGVIVCNDAAFKNNRRAVEFVTYRNFSTTNPLVTRPNLSSFIKTNFEVNNSLFGGSSNFIYHVSLWEVTGLGFTDCDFSNLCTTKTHSTSANRGITAIDANFYVKAGCSSGTSPCPDANLLKSTFTGFSTAIDASDNATTNTFSVDQTIFTGNLYGVVISGVNSASVNRSNFTFGGFTGTGLIPGSVHMGIFSQNATGFMLEENKFYRTASTTSAITGIRIDDAGTTNNRTYKNEYYSNYIGNEARGLNRHSTDQNSGYQALCSKFDNFGYTGYYVNGLGSSSNGVRYYQGNSVTSTATGNTFVNLVGGTIGLRNSTSNPITYYYAGSNSLPTISGSVTTTNVVNQNTCPSSFSSGTESKSLTSNGFSLSNAEYKKLDEELSLLQEESNNLAYVHASLIDGGNTGELIEKIERNWSEDAWLLHDELMTFAPNLSREAILSATGKNILPNAMILEICLANPESVRGEEFIEALKSSTQNAIPDHICDLIRSSWFEESGRTSIEKAIAQNAYEIQIRMNFKLTSVLNNEQSTDAEKLEELSKQHHPQALFEQITYFVDKGEFKTAKTELSKVSFKTATELQLFDGLEAYIDFREGLSLEGRKISQLNQEEIDLLLSWTSGKGKTALLAKNILCFFYQICFEPDNTLTAENNHSTVSNVSTNKNEVFYEVSAYPNPAIDYVSIKWNIYEKLNNCKVSMFDLNGTLIETKSIDRNSGENAFNTKSLAAGVYSYIIENNGEPKANGKIVIIRD